MTAHWKEEPSEVLVEHRLSRGGLQVKLDKGFEKGLSGVGEEYDELAARVGIRCRTPKGQGDCRLSQKASDPLRSGWGPAEIEDSSHTADPARKRDLEATFLSFPVRDGRRPLS